MGNGLSARGGFLIVGLNELRILLAHATDQTITMTQISDFKLIIERSLVTLHSIKNTTRLVLIRLLLPNTATWVLRFQSSL